MKTFAISFPGFTLIVSVQGHFIKRLPLKACLLYHKLLFIRFFYQTIVAWWHHMVTWIWVIDLARNGNLGCANAILGCAKCHLWWNSPWKWKNNGHFWVCNQLIYPCKTRVHGWLANTMIWVNTGSGNGLLPDGIKPLPEPMLTNHQRGPLAFSWGQFHRNWVRCHSLQSVCLLIWK